MDKEITKLAINKQNQQKILELKDKKSKNNVLAEKL